MQKHNIDLYLRIIAHYLGTDPNQTNKIEPTKYINILKNQQRIGNQSLYYGLFSTEWIKQQVTYRQATGLPNDKNQALTGIKAMIT